MDMGVADPYIAMVITGGAEEGTGNDETEQRRKPQGAYVFRWAVDVFHTSVCTENRCLDKTKKKREKTKFRRDRGY